MKWFPHDTDSLRNKKIRKAIRSHGAVAYAIWFAILEHIYSEEEDFQIVADELWLENLADDLRITDYRILIRVLDTFSEIGLIDSQMWQGEHIVFCQSVAERADKYLAKRMKEAEKKRKQRANKKQLSPRDKNGTTGQNTKMSPADPYSDLDQDLSFKAGEKKEARSQPELSEEIPTGYSNPQKYVHPAQRLEEQFRSQGGRNYPWRAGRNLLPGFAAYVGNSLPNTSDDSMPPAVKGSRYIRNRENEHDFEAIEGYLEAFQSGRAEKNTEELQREVVRSLQAANLPVRIPDGVPGAIAGGIIRNLTADQCELVLQRLGQVAS